METGKWKLENRNSDAESLEHDTKNCKLRPEVHLLSQRLPASVLPSLVSIFQFRFSIFQFPFSVFTLLAGLNLIDDLLRTGLRQMEKARAMSNLFKCGNEHLEVGQGFILEFSLDL